VGEHGSSVGVALAEEQVLMPGPVQPLVEAADPGEYRADEHSSLTLDPEQFGGAPAEQLATEVVVLGPGDRRRADPDVASDARRLRDRGQQHRAFPVLAGAGDEAGRVLVRAAQRTPPKMPLDNRRTSPRPETGKPLLTRGFRWWAVLGSNQ
jgi:hypothetical protein